MLKPIQKIRVLLLATLEARVRLLMDRLCENCGYPFWHHTGKELRGPIMNLCPYPNQGKQFKSRAVVRVKR